MRDGCAVQEAIHPIEPDPTPWAFPPVPEDHDDDLVAVGADLAPGTLLAAYRAGYFPMPIDAPGGIGWWSPDPRGIIELDELHVSRSLRRSIGRYDVTVDTAFDEVIAACAAPERPHGWIDGAIIGAYRRLHELGWVHSIECRLDGELVGGLYGVAIGSFFAGESMFHTATDASKVALVALVDILAGGAAPLLDVQWRTDHLASLGARDIPRRSYLARLPVACNAAGPRWPTGRGPSGP
jgi:leucyl/phenylalanyl-tRNA--protein transferase